MAIVGRMLNMKEYVNKLPTVNYGGTSVSDDEILKHLETYLNDEISDYANSGRAMILDDKYDYLHYGRYEMVTIIRDKITKLRKDERFV